MSSDMVYMDVTRKHKLDVFRLEPQLAYRSFDHSSGARHAGIEQNVPLESRYEPYLSSQIHHLQRLGEADLDLHSGLLQGFQGLRRRIDERGFLSVLLQVVKLPEVHRGILP